MTYEAEMKKFLEAKKLPANEGTYPEELMTQITIKAFEELDKRIEELELELAEIAVELSMFATKLDHIKNEICEEISWSNV